jgi:hypothetical protein
MALDHIAMADEVIAAMRHGASSKSILAIMGHTMAKYLRENTEVLFSWSGINSAPSSDPVTSYVTTDVIGDIFLEHPKVNETQLCHSHIAKQIQRDCGTFTIGPAPGWSVPRINLNNHSPPPLGPTKSNDQLISMRKMCNWVITMYKTYINGTPLMGSHGGYLAPSGAGAIMQAIF